MSQCYKHRCGWMAHAHIQLITQYHTNILIHSHKYIDTLSERSEWETVHMHVSHRKENEEKERERERMSERVTVQKNIRKTPQCARIYFRERTSDVLLYRVNIAKEPKIYSHSQDIHKNKIYEIRFKHKNKYRKSKRE